jgi:hypothetical protein
MHNQQQGSLCHEPLQQILRHCIDLLVPQLRL